LETQRRIHPNI